MKRIGIDAHVIGDKSGGNETYYQNLLNNIRINEKSEYNVYYSTNIDVKELILNDDGIKKINFRSNNSIVRNLIESTYIQRRDKLDLMHFQYFIPPINLCKTIVTIHDISFEHFDDIFEKSMLRIQKKLIPFSAKHSDKILTVSEFSKNDIVDKYGIDKDKIIVTHLAAAKEYRKIYNLTQAKKYIEKAFSIKGEYILSVGNLQPRKNIKRLIKVFIRLKKAELKNKIKLVIVGKKAWMYDDIFSEIKKNNLQEEIILTDYVTNEELVYLYNCCSIFVYPSFFEGFGLPPLEAMACGAAVITSNVTSIPEVVGKDSVMFNPYDEDDMYSKIKIVLENEEYRNKLRDYGLKRSKEFSWNNMSQKIMQAYESLL